MTACPSVVLYVPSPFSKRKYFTMLHELGHKLTDDEEDESIVDWLGELKNEREVIERVCDLVAGRLLVPNSTLDDVLGGERPTGQALARLHDGSNASREACAVALSRRLGCPGFVTVIRDDIVTFTSRVGEPKPAPWRDVPLPAVHPLRSIGEGGDPGRRKLVARLRWGSSPLLSTCPLHKTLDLRCVRRERPLECRSSAPSPRGEEGGSR